MSELLIRVVDRGEHISAPKAGDVVCIKEDGHQWSERERTNPKWRILRLPLLDSEIAALLAPPDLMPTQDLTPRPRRKFGFDLSLLPADVRTSLGLDPGADLEAIGRHGRVDMSPTAAELRISPSLNARLYSKDAAVREEAVALIAQASAEAAAEIPVVRLDAPTAKAVGEISDAAILDVSSDMKLITSIKFAIVLKPEV